jgi:hypothetical protein
MISGFMHSTTLKNNWRHCLRFSKTAKEASFVVAFTPSLRFFQ